MLSKSRLSLIGGLLLLSQCHLPIGEPPSKISPISDVESTRCLKDVLPTMQGFITSQTTPEKIHQAWECFRHGLTLFLTKIRPPKENIYPARDLADFFEKYFFENLHISNELLNQIMKIKQIIVGGSQHHFTRQEIQKLIHFSYVADVESQKVLPYMKVITFNWKPESLRLDDALSFYDKAIKAFISFGSAITEQFHPEPPAYSFSDLLILLDELAKLYNHKWEFLVSFKKASGASDIFIKELISGKDHSIRSKKQWTTLTKLLARTLGLIASYRYFLGNSHWDHHEGIFTENFLPALGYLLEDSITLSPNKKVKTKTVADIFLALSAGFESLMPLATVLDGHLHQIKKWFWGEPFDQWVISDVIKTWNKIQQVQNFVSSIKELARAWNEAKQEMENQPLPNQIDIFLKRSEDLSQIFDHLVGLLEANLDIISDLRPFLRDLIDQYKDKQTINQWVTAIYDQIPKLAALASLMRKDDRPTITPQSWIHFLRLSQMALSLSSVWQALIHQNSWRRWLQSYDVIVSKTFSYLNNLISIRSSELPWNTLSDLVFDPNQPATSNKQFLDSLAYLILNRWLDISTEQKVFLKRNHILKLQRLWSDFMEFENIISTFPHGFLDRSQIRTILERIPTPTTREVFKLVLYDTPVLLATNENFLLNFSHSLKHQISYPSLQNVNIFRILTQLIVNRYGSRNWRLGLSKNEYHQLLQDVEQLLLQIGAILPGELYEFGDSRFFEANLFLPLSNGNQQLEFGELFYILQFMLSGSFRAKLIADQYKSQCPIQKNSIPLDCWISAYRVKLKDSLEFMDLAFKSYSSLSRNEFFNHWVTLLNAVGYDARKKPSSIWVPLSSINLVPYFLQYVESIIFTFDNNNDDILDKNEAFESYPRFEQLLKDHLQGKDENFYKALFAYLLHFKRFPTSWQDKLYFASVWQRFPSRWNILIDRLGIAQAISAVVDQSNSKK